MSLILYPEEKSLNNSSFYKTLRRLGILLNGEINLSNITKYFFVSLYILQYYISEENISSEKYNILYRNVHVYFNSNILIYLVPE